MLDLLLIMSSFCHQRACLNFRLQAGEGIHFCRRLSSESDPPVAMLSSGAETRPRSSLVIAPASSSVPMFPNDALSLLLPASLFPESGLESCGFWATAFLFSSTHSISASYSEGWPEEPTNLSPIQPSWSSSPGQIIPVRFRWSLALLHEV